MNGNDLLKALSYVDEKYVDEADQPVRRAFRWQPIAAAAACFCLFLLAARVWMPLQEVQNVAFVPQMEAAKGVVSEEIMVDAAEVMEAADANSVYAAAPLQMTVRTVGLSDSILTCTVTDPGTSGFAAGKNIQISLTEEQQQEWLPSFDETRDTVLLTISFLPTDGDTIEPIEMVPVDETP